MEDGREEYHEHAGAGEIVVCSTKFCEARGMADVRAQLNLNFGNTTAESSDSAASQDRHSTTSNGINSDPNSMSSANKTRAASGSEVLRKKAVALEGAKNKAEARLNNPRQCAVCWGADLEMMRWPRKHACCCASSCGEHII